MKIIKGQILFFAIVIFILTFGCEKRTSPDRCDYDGFHIQSNYAVYFSLQDGSEMKFCSLVCASISFQQFKAKGVKVMVTDEVSGAQIHASQAFFVESEVVSVPHVRNRMHVFEKRQDAERHLNRFKGRWVENPFR